MLKKLLPAFAALLLAASISAADLATKKTLTLELAKGIAAASEAHAKANNWNVVIAILDDGGHLIYLQRMDDVQTGSILVAQRKAETAASFRRPSKVVQRRRRRPQSSIVSLPGALRL